MALDIIGGYDPTSSDKGYQKEMTSGQLKYGAKKNSETAKIFYQLGKAESGLEQQRKENEQASLLNQAQAQLLSTKELEVQQGFAELNIAMKALQAQQQLAMAGAPPVMGGVPPVGIAPPPIDSSLGAGPMPDPQMSGDPSMMAVPPQGGI